MTMVNSYPEKMNLSFSGCGFLCIYHVGVAAAIKEYAPQLCENKISGASAGSIVAAGLLTGVCISQATSTILKIVSQARSRALGPLHPAFNLLGLVREEIVRTLPPDAYKRCTNRLQISLTRWSDSKNVVVDEYDSNEELIDAIICSCFIPVYCGVIPPKYRGVAYIDGGFTDNQPSYDDHTVTVSPFSGESDICPPDWDSGSFFGLSFSRTSIRFTTRNLFRLTACLMPPSTDDCSKMCLQGFEDALRFLTKNGMAPCIRCLTIQTNVEQPGDKDMQAVAPARERKHLSPMSHRPHRISSSNMIRRMPFESECDTCCESDYVHDGSVGHVFPSVMKKTFDEAFAAEDSMFQYLLSFRLFRYARTALGVGKLPWDMLIIFTKNMASWLTTVTAPDWLIAKMMSLVDFVHSEIDNQRNRYSMFSCQLALTELEHKKSQHVIVEQKEMQLEMSEQARAELAALRAADRRRRKRLAASSTSSSTNAMEWDDFVGHGPDSLEHVIEYTQNHDAMYAFHYMDENNKMHGVELFNIDDKKKKHSCHERTSGYILSSPKPSATTPRPVSMVLEEEEIPPTPSCSRENDDADSGLSGVEQQSVSRRDACCSPVRSFEEPTHTHRSNSFRNKPSTRRHTGAAASATASRRLTFPLDVAASSDSEADASDRFFVPSRRSRRQSSDYDGEPEPSDTDAAS